MKCNMALLIVSFLIVAAMASVLEGQALGGKWKDFMNSGLKKMQFE